MSKSIRLGPFSELQIKEIQAKFDPLKIDYTIEIDPVIARKYETNRPEWAHGLRDEDENYLRRFHSSADSLSADFFFIEVNEQFLLASKDILSPMGLYIDPNAEFIPDNELFCPRCDYTATQVGICPKHSVQLVDYFTQINLKKKNKNNSIWLFYIVPVVICIALVVFQKMFP